RQVADIARSNPQLSLIIFDSKLTGAGHGAELLGYVRSAFAGLNLSFIYSVAHVDMTTFFDSIKGQLGPREGLMVDQTEDVGRVVNWFQTNNVRNGAYGDGIQDASGVEVAMDDAVALKLQVGSPKWTYFWNLRPDGMRDAIRTGVDGIDPKDIGDCRA